MASFGIKAPGDRLDYTFALATDLAAGETLLPPTITATPGGIAIDAATVSGGTVLVWIEGGTPGASYDIACTVRTSLARRFFADATLTVGAVGLDSSGTGGVYTTRLVPALNFEVGANTISDLLLL
jgi:hypothetical protein